MSSSKTLPSSRAPSPRARRDLPGIRSLADLSTARYSVEDAAESVGLDPEAIRRLRRAVGLPADEGVAAISDEDLVALGVVREFLRTHHVDERLIVQMARTLGHATSRVAATQVSAMQDWLADVVDAAPPDDPERVADALEVMDGALELFEVLLVYTWRRHFAHASSNHGGSVPGESGARESVESVGFGDLAGFTGRSNQMDFAELARVIDKFEALAFDVVGAHGGRVVKMIGDEVMFAASRPEEAAAIGLELAEACEADADLPAMRVGVSHGPVLSLGGDLFGATVNYASRLAALAPSGGLLVNESMRIGLSDMPGLRTHAQLRLIDGAGWRVVYTVSRSRGSSVRDLATVASVQDVAITMAAAGRNVVERLAGVVTTAVAGVARDLPRTAAIPRWRLGPASRSAVGAVLSHASISGEAPRPSTDAPSTGIVPGNRPSRPPLGAADSMARWA